MSNEFTTIPIVLANLNDLQEKLRTEVKENKEDKGWIQTHSGIKFYPFAPKIEDIKIEDIAWHLSGINRFLGACTTQWSVAQHSILGAWIIYKLTGDKLLAKWFLLHDAPEAYLGDLIRPFKVLPEFAFYREKEKWLYGMILDCFDVIIDNVKHPTMDHIHWDGKEPEIIKEIDRLMLYTEIENLRNPIHPDNAYMPGSTEHLELKSKYQWNERCQAHFEELLKRDSKVIYQTFLYYFNLYSKE